MKAMETQPLKKEGELVYEPLPPIDQLEAAKAFKQFLLSLFKTPVGETNDLPIIV